MIKREVYKRAENEKINYIVYTPKELKNSLPLIVFLHGAGERGTNIDHIPKLGLPRLVEEGYEYDAIILCPQCHEALVWNNVVCELKEVIDRVAEKYGADKSRISITGGSMGGFGTWEMGLCFPNFFSAIAPVCGGGLSWRTSNLVTTPVFAFHGRKDQIVPLIYSELMVDGVNKNGGSATLTVFEELGHNDAIDEAYRNTDLVERLMTVRRESFEPVSEAFSQYF